MANRRTASCSCGQLVAIAHGEPARVAVCHCTACQRRTGSAYGVQARFSRSQVVVRGSSSVYHRVADSGNSIDSHFCPSCGSTVYMELSADTELLVIPVGAFTDANFPSPKVSIYEARMHPWVGLNTEVEHWD